MRGFLSVFFEVSFLEWPAIALAAALWIAAHLKNKACRRSGVMPAGRSLHAGGIFAFILLVDFLVLGYLAFAPYRYACSPEAQTREMVLLLVWVVALQPAAVFATLRLMDAARLPLEALSQHRGLIRRMNAAITLCFTALFLLGTFFQFHHPVSVDFKGCSPGLTRIDAKNLVIAPQELAPDPK